MKYAVSIYYTEIIIEITPKYSKPFALLLIGIHEMIDYFSGVDTNYFAEGGRGDILVGENLGFE